MADEHHVIRLNVPWDKYNVGEKVSVTARQAAALCSRDIMVRDVGLVRVAEDLGIETEYRRGLGLDKMVREGRAGATVKA